jgi:choline dehydrogenase-like flavoprotein
VDRITGERSTLAAERFVLAAGALATPHLLLASRLDGCNPAGASIGRYLMRHRNAVVFGVYARQPNPERAFDKQIAIHDFYHGDPALATAPTGPLGGIQQLTPPVELVRAYLPFGVRDPAATLVSHATGLLVIAEDQPRRENGVAIDWTRCDRFGLPRLRVCHRHSERDEAAAGALVVRAKQILRETGARITYVHPIETFSHALGTVRMGVDPDASPLDGSGRFRGLDNLYVTDASALPRSAGVNPSLTIAANALRIGSELARSSGAAHGRRLAVIDGHHTFSPNAAS